MPPNQRALRPATPEGLLAHNTRVGAIHGLVSAASRRCLTYPLVSYLKETRSLVR
jgi:hypothetical protein